MTTYEVAPDKSWIRCFRCGRTSHHPEDVANLYCGACGDHDFMVGAPVPFRGPSPPVEQVRRRPRGRKPPTE